MSDSNPGLSTPPTAPIWVAGDHGTRISFCGRLAAEADAEAIDGCDMLVQLFLTDDNRCVLTVDTREVETRNEQSAVYLLPNFAAVATVLDNDELVAELDYDLNFATYQPWLAGSRSAPSTDG